MTVRIHRHRSLGCVSASVVEDTERRAARFRLRQGADELDELARTAPAAEAARLRYAERALAMRARADRT